MTIKAYLIKCVEDKSGHTNDFHLLETNDIKLDMNDGAFSTTEFQFQVYKDMQAYIDGKALVDNLTCRLGKITITDAEIKAESGSLHGEQIVKAFLRKAVTSVSVDGVETNLFDGRVQGVDYIGVAVE